MRHIIPISGKDSLCTAIVQMTINPELNYEYVFNPTGAELPDVFDWLKKVEKKLNIKINYVGKNLEQIIKDYNYFLPNYRQRYCTRQAKIEPFVKWIGKDDATVYYGIRADENRQGFDNKTNPNITPSYPLIDAKIDLKAVYIILNKQDLKPPTFFWQRLFDEVQKDFPYPLDSILDEWQIDILFAWRSRANCYFCFNQKVSELVGLLEHYPDLFDKMEWYENQGGDKKFCWRDGYPCEKIRINKDKYLKNHVKNTIQKINKLRQQHLFIVDNDDFMNMKSCGLFCGK